MKKLLAYVALTFCIVTSYGQPDTVLRVKTDRNNIYIKERYYVLKKDKKIRYGNYLKYGASMSQIYLLAEGRYVNNLKSGIWRFYYNLMPYNQIHSKGRLKNDQKEGYWEFFYHSMYYNPEQSDSNKRDFKDQNGTAVYYIREGAKKSSGYFDNGKKTGVWNYFNTTGDTILTLDHSKDSVLNIDYAFLPERDSSGIIRPFFEGGSNYFYLMHQSTPFIELDQAGTITYRLTVDKNNPESNLVLVENKTSIATEAAVQKRISPFLEEWIPQINNRKIEAGEITLFVTVKKRTLSSTITPSFDPSRSFSVSKDIYSFRIEVKK